MRPHSNSIPHSNSTYNSLGLTYRRCVCLSHLREYKFRHNFRDSLDPICNCSNTTESTKHLKGTCSCKILGWLTQIFYPWTRIHLLRVDSVTTLWGQFFKVVIPWYTLFSYNTLLHFFKVRVEYLNNFIL